MNSRDVNSVIPKLHNSLITLDVGCTCNHMNTGERLNQVERGIKLGCGSVAHRKFQATT